MTLARLRLGLPLQHIANLFNISIATVSKVFTSRINLLYFVLGSINLWLPKHTIQETMPDSFRQFPSTRVIVDANEFKIQTPSSLLRQSQIFSQYKSTTTAKTLLDIAPSGSVTFVLSCILEAYRTRKSPNSVEFSHCLKEGTMQWLIEVL